MATLAPVPDSRTATRPVPLRQLAWVAWRRNRATALGLVGFLAALATYLLVTGLQAHAAYDDLGSCVPPITTDACRIRWDSFINSHGQRGLTGPLLVLLPGIVGAVVGAPLIGRELESGVFRYSWTQGVGRMRWAVVIILPIAILTAALMDALGLLVSWRKGPVAAAGATQRLDSSTFPTTGVAVIGWTLLGLSAGVLAGLLWRRVVPAVATSFGPGSASPSWPRCCDPTCWRRSPASAHHPSGAWTSPTTGPRTGCASVSPRSARSWRRSVSG